MSEFQLYYGLGMDHILDWAGYDHILFVVALCALYEYDEVKKILILVTAFTIGHSITLALATLNIIKVDMNLVEFLIPCTILVTALSNIFLKKSASRNISMNYLFAGIFGLIHGLGFSNYLQSLLGKDSSIITQLLAFNVGLEVGQIIIVAIFMAFVFLFVTIFGVNHRDWKLAISSAVGGISLTLILEAMYW